MKRIIPSVPGLPVALVGVAALLALSPFTLSEPILTEAPAVPAMSGHAPGTAALRATVNPETGKVDVSTIPSGVQSMRPLDPNTANALRRDTEGLVQVLHPNGAVSVDLKGRFQSASVARIDENGKVIICTDDGRDVRDFLDGRPVASPEQARTPEVR